jgi:uncharacterized SAM-binding protein YcdF (DUF218 family)
MRDSYKALDGLCLHGNGVVETNWNLSLARTDMIRLLKSGSTPLVWVFVLLILGLVATRFRRRKLVSRVGWCLMLLGTLVLYAFSIAPVSQGLLYSLESRYRPATATTLATLDAVVILGGGIHRSGGLRERAEASEWTRARVQEGVSLFQQSSAKVLALCGGRATADCASDADVMKTLAGQMGVRTEQIITETTSKNTMENASRLASLLPAGEGRRIGLVTSAVHMRRAEATFRHQFPDDTIVALPVHYLYTPPRTMIGRVIPSDSHLSRSTAALHEWIGLAWYSARYW